MAVDQQIVHLVTGLAGFALTGFVLQHLAEGRRFSEQSVSRKRAIVALALVQWPYLYFAASAAWSLFRGYA